MIRKKNNDDKKSLCLEALNPQKGQIVWEIKEIFRSKQWLTRHNIPCKLTTVLDYACDNELKKS